MVKKLEEVFDIPIKQEKECADKCGCGKPPNKMDPELQSEIDKYLNSIKTEIATSKAPPAKAPRKHNLTPEGKEKMLSNIQKAREVRRMNVEKSKAHEPQKEIPTPMAKQETPPIKMEPKAQAAPVIQPVIKAEPIQQAPEPKGSLKPEGFPKTPYIIKSSFKRAPWVK